MPGMNQRKERIVRRTARVTAVAVFLLLIAGALVTSTESGLAVPDWPLSYGRLLPPMVGGILYEHGHRMVAALVTFFVGLQMGVILWGERRRAVRRLGVFAFGAILAQAILGGLTVLFLLPPAVSSAHAGLAQVVFAATVAIAWMTSRSFLSGALVERVEAADAARLGTAFRLSSLAALATYGQILLGAVIRHTGAGLAIPDFPLSFGRLAPTAAEFARRGVGIAFAHRAFAVVTALLVLAAIGAAWRLRERIPALGALTAVWGSILALQLTLGALSVWSKKAVPVTTAHLAVGGLLWVTAVLTALTLATGRARALGAGGALPARPAPRLRDLVELTKPRITLFVVLTAFVGFSAGTAGPLSTLNLALLVHTLIGTALVASGTSAFNQLFEIALDARMARTANRPLPSGRLSPRAAFVFASALSAVGIAELALFANGITALLAAVTLVSYVGLYTPMKKVSPVSTIVGAVPGALPPLGGFTAAQGSIAAPGLVLFAILFLWQLPHFFAIGWRHRADYALAGVRILPTIDPGGKRTGRHALGWCLLLVPATLLPAALGMAGTVYAVGAMGLTLAFLAASFRFARETTDERALTLFLASIGWLPAVLVLLVADRIVP
jgi:protoheme IX farnesyltransferase